MEPEQRGEMDVARAASSGNAATLSVFAHGLSELVLAFCMSMVNVEQMSVMGAASKKGKDPKQVAQAFLNSPYYRNRSWAQLNNTEYAPMLAVLCFIVKYRADQKKRDLTLSEKVACIGSVVFSYMFVYAAWTQPVLDLKNLKPGSGGMSPLRPMGAMGRYSC